MNKTVHKYIFVLLTLLCLLLLQVEAEKDANWSATHSVARQNKTLSDLLDPKSIVDDCCCEVNRVIFSNHKYLNPLLNQLTDTRFFKYFKVDLYRECPFWVADFLCGTGSCSICDCNEDEVPRFWQQKTDLVNVETPPNFHSWKDNQENMWIIQGDEKDMSYVNLKMYPETNTGYGEGGRMIWQSIYNENCFKGTLDSMCLEERVFYRLISGMHTSITTHICAYYDNSTGVWKPNIELFKSSVYDHPDRIENLYFAFLFLARAVQKAAPVLLTYDYDTGKPEEDRQTKLLMKHLLEVDLLCSPTFNESMLFTSPEKEALRQQAKQHFRNISQIMDCVSCEKCKVWAKLQVLGVGTALKLLLEPDTDTVLKQLQRNEIIALINTLRQFSVSVENVQKFISIIESGGSEQTDKVDMQIIFFPLSLLAGALYIIYHKKKIRQRQKSE